MTTNHSALGGDPYYEGVPDYMTEVYDWAYVNPRWVRALDRNVVVRTLLFLNDRRLMRAYLDEIREGMSVWQLAHVYGDLVIHAAKKVGARGVFHLTDVTPAQLEHGTRKLAGMPWTRVIRSDAAEFEAPQATRYDLICSFFLLHEVPAEKKYQIVDNMLRQLAPGSKIVFVDYHRPAYWQPVRYILKLVNRYLEPFADDLWRHEIRHYASEADRFRWTKRTFFGGVYQCVIVEHL